VERDGAHDVVERETRPRQGRGPFLVRQRDAAQDHQLPRRRRPPAHARELRDRPPSDRPGSPTGSTFLATPTSGTSPSTTSSPASVDSRPAPAPSAFAAASSTPCAAQSRGDLLVLKGIGVQGSFDFSALLRATRARHVIAEQDVLPFPTLSIGGAFEAACADLQSISFGWAAMSRRDLSDADVAVHFASYPRWRYPFAVAFRDDKTRVLHRSRRRTHSCPFLPGGVVVVEVAGRRPARRRLRRRPDIRKRRSPAVRFTDDLSSRSYRSVVVAAAAGRRSSLSSFSLVRYSQPRRRRRRQERARRKGRAPEKE